MKEDRQLLLLWGRDNAMLRQRKSESDECLTLLQRRRVISSISSDVHKTASLNAFASLENFYPVHLSIMGELQ
jgi:hypothetical protein